MIQRVEDRFDEWRRLPVPQGSADPRFEVRRACPSEFERIYDLVDETFDFKRPRALYDWLYRRNPSGTAQCWIVIEKTTGQIVSSEARFPWPVARRDEALAGVLLGDVVTAPRWQGQGIYQIRRRVRDSHPWSQTTVTIGTPNEKTLGAVRKHGLGETIMGPLPGGALLLRTQGVLARLRWPRALARATAPVADLVFGTWRRSFFSRRARSVVEDVQRFDSGFDNVTERYMGWPRFWCPHDAGFLNWRYLDHPTRRYRALAMADSRGLAGYCVVRIQGERALLMEFVAPRGPQRMRHGLLFHAINAAQDAGCQQLDFFAPPGWRHWQLFHHAGFIGYRTKVFLAARGLYEPEVFQLANWQVVPGDTDYA